MWPLQSGGGGGCGSDSSSTAASTTAAASGSLGRYALVGSLLKNSIQFKRIQFQSELLTRSLAPDQLDGSRPATLIIFCSLFGANDANNKWPRSACRAACRCSPVGAIGARGPS